MTEGAASAQATIRELDESSYAAAIPGLAALLVDVVEGGASVNFLAGVTMEEAAAELGVSVATIRTMVTQGKLPARHVAEGVPWMIERSDLAHPEVEARVRHAKLGLKSPREDADQTVMPCI